MVTIPPGLQTASICWANIKSPFLPVVGAQPQRKRSGYSILRARIILTEWRIGDHAVEAFKLARLSVHRVKQRVLELYVGAGNAVQKHVQLADRPGRGIVHLATEPDVAGIAAGLLDELAADDEHAA